MKKLFLLLIAAFTLLNACSTSKPVTVKAETEYESYTPGSKVNVAFKFEMKDDWHIYWQNPGDAGLPTEINWNFPDGFRDAYNQYQIPLKQISSEIADYIYYPNSTIISSFRLPKNLPPDTNITLTAYVTWLRCKNICIPGADTITLEVSIDSKTPKKTNKNNEIEEYITKKFPFDSDIWKIHLNKTDSTMIFYLQPEDGNTREIKNIEFYPITEGIFSNNKEQKLTLENGEFVLVVPFEPFRYAEPNNFEGIFIADKPWEEGKSRGIRIKIMMD